MFILGLTLFLLFVLSITLRRDLIDAFGVRRTARMNSLVIPCFAIQAMFHYVVSHKPHHPGLMWDTQRVCLSFVATPCIRLLF